MHGFPRIASYQSRLETWRLFLPDMKMLRRRLILRFRFAVMDLLRHRGRQVGLLSFAERIGDIKIVRRGERGFAYVRWYAVIYWGILSDFVLTLSYDGFSFGGGNNIVKFYAWCWRDQISVALSENLSRRKRNGEGLKYWNSKRKTQEQGANIDFIILLKMKVSDEIQKRCRQSPPISIASNTSFVAIFLSVVGFVAVGTRRENNIRLSWGKDAMRALGKVPLNGVGITFNARRLTQAREI